MWCSGITPAQHAGGPGLNPQRVHASTHALNHNVKRCQSAAKVMHDRSECILGTGHVARS